MRAVPALQIPECSDKEYRGKFSRPCLLIPCFHHHPVHNPPQSLQVGGPAVLVVQIVGVFPDVEGEEGDLGLGDRVVGVGFPVDDEAAVPFGGEPYPAATEEAGAFLLEFGFEDFE